MDRDLVLVEAPSRWASDVCTFEGIDYERILREVPEPGRNAGRARARP